MWVKNIDPKCSRGHSEYSVNVQQNREDNALGVKWSGDKDWESLGGNWKLMTNLFLFIEMICWIYKISMRVPMRRSGSSLDFTIVCCELWRLNLTLPSWTCLELRKCNVTLRNYTYNEQQQSRSLYCGCVWQQGEGGLSTRYFYCGTIRTRHRRQDEMRCDMSLIPS